SAERIRSAICSGVMVGRDLPAIVLPRRYYAHAEVPMNNAPHSRGPMTDFTDVEAAGSAALLRSARRTFEIEAAALAALEACLDEAFARACRICLACSGRVVV